MLYFLTCKGCLQSYTVHFILNTILQFLFVITQRFIEFLVVLELRNIKST